MTISIKTDSLEPELVIEGYGGAYDAAGDLGNFQIDVPLGGIDGMYKLAADIVAAANRHREELIERAEEERKRPGYGVRLYANGTPIPPGPFVLAPAKKRPPVEDADDLKARMEARVQVLRDAVTRGPTHGVCIPDRMRAWTVTLPEDPEVGKLFKGIMIDNLGGITVAMPGPAILSISEGNVSLMGHGTGIGYSTTGKEYVRLELRPIVPIDSPKETP